MKVTGRLLKTDSVYYLSTEDDRYRILAAEESIAKSRYYQVQQFELNTFVGMEVTGTVEDDTDPIHGILGCIKFRSLSIPFLEEGLKTLEANKSLRS